MTDDNEHVLRRSLDAVDRQRNILFVGLAITIGLLLLVFLHGAAAVQVEHTSTFQTILAHYFLLLIWITALTLFVVIQITLMTKRILRAIELASRK